MMVRGAVNDQQQEEYAIYREAADDMDRQLMQKSNSDTVVKMLHRNKNAHLGQFLSGTAKRSLAEQRLADEAVQQQYYQYQFKWTKILYEQYGMVLNILMSQLHRDLCTVL